MFCGLAGHIAKDCKKEGSSASKARAVKTSDAAAAPSAPSSAQITTVSEK
jgi:hypothetical protein